MRPNDIDPKAIKRFEEESSIFTKRGSTYREMADALDTQTSPLSLVDLAKSTNLSVQAAVASNPNTPIFLLIKFLGHPDREISKNARRNLHDLDKNNVIDLSDKGLFDYVMKYEKDNLKVIEIFQDLKDQIRNQGK